MPQLRRGALISANRERSDELVRWFKKLIGRARSVKGCHRQATERVRPACIAPSTADSTAPGGS
ncbi:hypothetical protein SBRY_40644 [Actinacidiphila bryophytorum]|uniref:Uncharacterized protein n=1 Tax=Actinacidiphila bryophytorum TaxID=1436133 RepID=A0A9W4H3I2_9ACTN|nr:hypothetical protein SBRY_40644 [Actinacidiphila bryophytorum]